MSRLTRLLPLAIVLGGGLFLWRTGGFGLLPTERSVTWRLPVSYAEVRGVELQLWRGEELLKREERRFETGVVGELTMSVPLAAGAHRAISTVRLQGRAEPLGFQREFDPGSDEALVIDLGKR